MLFENLYNSLTSNNTFTIWYKLNVNANYENKIKSHIITVPLKN